MTIDPSNTRDVLRIGPKVKRRKLYEEIADKIETWIRTGYFKEGDRLPSERELMKMLGTGRTSVREAMFALDRVGLITVKNGGRAVVSRPDAGVILGELSSVVQAMLRDPEGQRQFQDARRLWEAAIAREAARRATKVDIDDLAHYLEANRKAIGDVDEFARTDVAFHARIAAICGNPLFNSLNNTLADWLTEQRLTSLREPRTARKAFEAHVSIFNALKGRDADGAEAAMSAHLGEVAETYWEAVKRAG